MVLVLMPILVPGPAGPSRWQAYNTGVNKWLGFQSSMPVGTPRRLARLGRTSCAAVATCFDRMNTLSRRVVLVAWRLSSRFGFEYSMCRSWHRRAGSTQIRLLDRRPWSIRLNDTPMWYVPPFVRTRTEQLQCQASTLLRVTVRPYGETELGCQMRPVRAPVLPPANACDDSRTTALYARIGNIANKLQILQKGRGRLDALL